MCSTHGVPPRRSSGCGDPPFSGWKCSWVSRSDRDLRSDDFRHGFYTSPPVKWVFSLLWKQENDIPRIWRWWQLKYCESSHPEPWRNDPIFFQRGLKPPTRYTYYHIFLFVYVQMRWKKNNKSGWLISGITVPAVIGISIDPGESLFKSNKGFIIEISFGSKKWISIATFCHIGFSLMKFLEGERFWVFQNLTHASCFMRGTGGTPLTSRITKRGIISSFTIFYDTTRSCTLKLIPYHWIKFVPFVITSIVSWCSLVHITWCWIARTTWTYCALFNYCILPYTSVEVPACSIWLIHERVFSTVLIY